MLHKKLIFLSLLIASLSFSSALHASSTTIDTPFSVDVAIPTEVYIAPLSPITITDAQDKRNFPTGGLDVPICIYSNAANNQYKITFTGEHADGGGLAGFPFQLVRTNPSIGAEEYFAYRANFTAYNGTPVNAPNGQQLPSSFTGSNDQSCSDNHKAKLNLLFSMVCYDLDRCGAILYGIYSDTLTIKVAAI